MNRLVVGGLLICVGLLSLAGCGRALPAPTVSAPAVFSTATLVWQSGRVIDKAQAALAGLNALGATHLNYRQPPQVIFVAPAGSPEAQPRLQAIRALAPGANAWLVVLEGDYQIIGPTMPVTPSNVPPTPLPFVHGCVFVLLNGDDGQLMQAGTTTTCQ